MDPCIHGSTDPGIHGSMDAWIHGPMDPWIHASMEPKVGPKVGPSLKGPYRGGESPSVTFFPSVQFGMFLEGSHLCNFCSPVSSLVCFLMQGVLEKKPYENSEIIRKNNSRCFWIESWNSYEVRSYASYRAENGTILRSFSRSLTWD